MYIAMVEGTKHVYHHVERGPFLSSSFQKSVVPLGNMVQSGHCLALQIEDNAKVEDNAMAPISPGENTHVDSVGCGCFHKWGYPILWWVYQGRSHLKSWFRATPILGNHHVAFWGVLRFFFQPWEPRSCHEFLAQTDILWGGTDFQEHLTVLERPHPSTWGTLGPWVLGSLD